MKGILERMLELERVCVWDGVEGGDLWCGECVEEELFMLIYGC